KLLIPRQCACKITRSLSPDGYIRQAARKLISFFQNAARIVLVIKFPILPSDRHHKVYAVGIVDSMLSLDNGLGTLEKFGGRERLTGRSRIGKQNLVKLIENL